jgi:N-acetylmuramoyl-L-alanine amidase
MSLLRLRWALVFALAAFPAAVSAASPAAPVAEGRFGTVVVDAGHGGGDHGARGPKGLLEKNLVLDVARRLVKRLSAQGLGVVMTRDADAFVPLEERTRIANDAAADLFVSIHANASSLRGVHGIETFFASLEATDESARALAQRENLAFGATAARAGEGDPLLAILGDLLATEHLADAQEFARMTQRRLATAEASRSRGVKQAPFVVLMGVHMPAVLVEVGFLTNSAEEGRLVGERERERIAGGLADAVAAFRRRQDARLGLADAAGGPR